MLTKSVLPTIKVATIDRYTGEVSPLRELPTQTEAELFARQTVSSTTNVMVFHYEPESDWCFRCTAFYVDQVTEQVVSEEVEVA